MLFAKDHLQRVYTTGSVPTTTNTWYMRWDAPSENDSTIIEQFINNAQTVNVFVGPSMNGPFRYVDRFTDRYPNLTDAAGSNTRNPQKRMLYVTLRGGAANRFYKFMLVPEVAITMKINMNINNFFVDNFVANVALLLGIPTSRIKIVSVRAGSVLLDFTILPNNTVATTSAQVNQQVCSNYFNCCQEILILMWITVPASCQYNHYCCKRCLFQRI